MRKPILNIRGYSIALSSQFFLWPILLFAALLFAQSLKMAVSHMVFVFVLLMPIGAIVQPLLAIVFIRTSARIEKTTVEKHTPVQFNAIVSNSSILPFPFIEAELSLPDDRGIGCTSKRFILSLAPFAGCSIDRSLEFSFRGEYRVGIRAISVCDYFRTVKIAIPCDRYCDLFVLPRRFELPPRPNAYESELETQHVMRAIGSDNTELSDIRSYINGDSLKSIHWKLSSKSEDLIVKDYSRNNGNSVCILCDLEPHYANLGEREPITAPLPEYAEIIDMLSTDLVIETCIASALRELRAGNDVTLMWMSGGAPASAELHSLTDFNALYRRFATAPLDPIDKQLTKLVLEKRNTENLSLILVTAYLDAASAVEYAALAALYNESGAKAPELLYCADDSLFIKDEAADKRQRDCILELERAGISVISIDREPRSE